VTYGPLERYVKKLMGRPGIENALARLDRLAQDEDRWQLHNLLRAAYVVDKKLGTVNDEVQVVDDTVKTAVNVVIDVRNYFQPAIHTVLNILMHRWSEDKRKDSVTLWSQGGCASVRIEARRETGFG
jgi:hypothetical protein